MKYDEKFEWFEDDYEIEGNFVGILYLTQNQEKAEKCNKALQRLPNDVFDKARQYVYDHYKDNVKEWGGDQETAKQLLSIKVEALTFLSPRRFEILFNDNNVFAGHTIVVEVSDKKFTNCYLEG